MNGLSASVKRSIHVVDDEPVIAWTLGAILEQHGFHALTFTNPAICLLEAAVAPPILLITDIVMPQLSGVELAMRMKALCPECKVILFSGQAGTLDHLAEAARRDHSFEILSKPMQPEALLAAVKSVTEE